jgi:hypothetical protein
METLYDTYRDVLTAPGKKIHAMNVPFAGKHFPPLSDPHRSVADPETATQMIAMFAQEHPRIAHIARHHPLANIQIMVAPPGNDVQRFHYDFRAEETYTFIVPYVPFTDLNGTVYVHFYDPRHYHTLFDAFAFQDRMIADDDIHQGLIKYGLQRDIDYTVRILNADSFSVTEMPYYIIHRGQSNRTSVLRPMMTITFSQGRVFDFILYNTPQHMADSEVDEEFLVAEKQRLKDIPASISV